ncbi:hypothetical protein PHYPSEUDO_010585, partial [Phytophthora pseudosyringae]
MDIADLLNVDDDAADWEFEVSDAEEDEEGEGDLDDEGDGVESDSDAQPTERQTGNAYVDNLIRDSGLHIIREREVKAAYTERGALELFSLFFTRTVRIGLQGKWNAMGLEAAKARLDKAER